MKQKDPLTIIGSRELVSLPDLGLRNIPAKIDTGADSSAIWASGINESKGKLSFYLFDKGSRHFTGQKITTDNYGFVRIKNSFGHSEARYMTTLVVRIGSRRVRVQFNLANRSQNRYPILIGKSTLFNKFVVDVSTKLRLRTQKDIPRILVLSSSSMPSVETFYEKLNRLKMGHFECITRTYDDIGFELSGDTVKAFDLVAGVPLEHYDVVYFRTYFKRAELAAALSEYLTAKQMPFFDEEVGNYHAQTKLTQYMRIALNEIAVPDTVFIPRKHLASAYEKCAARLKTPFVLKDIAAERGLRNYLVKSAEEFEEILAQNDESVEFVAQKFIVNKGDLRVLVFDKKVFGVIERLRKGDSTHINNTSLGAEAKWQETASLSPEAKSTALKSAIIMKRQVAGVDLIYSGGDRAWMVLEVNNAPQLANGAFLDEKLGIFGDFLQSYINKKVLR